MSKHHIKKSTELITDYIIEKKDFEVGLIEIMKKYKIDGNNEIEIINNIIKSLISKGYYIENYSPLKIKEI